MRIMHIKLHFILFSLVFAIGAWAQTNIDLFRAVPPAIFLGGGSVPFGKSLSSWPMWTWHKTNINFIVDTPKPCPLEYTNVISNTNLFSPGEQTLIKELPLQYENVTTDSPPAGFRLVEVMPGQNALAAFTIVRFQSTNSEAQIRAFYLDGFGHIKGGLTEIDFITKSGDGYEALFDLNGHCAGLLELKNGKPDGLWADIVKGHCVAWARYKEGLLVGKYLLWNESGTLYMEAQFKRPYDLLHHMTLGP